MSTKRWSATGFMAGGVASVEPATHTLKDAVMVRPGEARGHGMWIDSDFCKSVSEMANAGKAAGLKARFGHPNMCSEALGTFLGRWTNVRQLEDGRVVGDLHLSSTAAESPKGDLRKYVEELAAKEPEHFGASIVFTRNEEAENEFMRAHLNTEKSMGDEAGQSFKSPDPANGQNLPHARCAELHAADLVDDPAATDGMFSAASGAALAAQMTEWLDTHPDVFKALQEPGMLEMLQRYSDKLAPFIQVYTANQPTVPAELGTEKPKPEPTAEIVQAQAKAAEENQKLTARVSELEAEITRLSGELAGAVKRAESAEASTKALTVGRDEIAGRLTKAEAELSEANRKVAAYEKGQPPVSGAPAPESGFTGNMWSDAQKR